MTAVQQLHPHVPFRDPESGLMMVGIGPEMRPLVTPLHILAAQRASFDCIVRRNLFNIDKVCALIFDALPLEQNGWCRVKAKLQHIGNSEGRFPIWRVTRG